MTYRTSQRPTYHLTLTDGESNTAGLVLCTPAGKPDPRAMREGPMPKTSLQISQGDPTYGSYQLPFSAITMKDFSGGMHQLYFNKDQTRFADEYLIDTRMGDILLGPATNFPIYGGGPPPPPTNNTISTAGEYCSPFTSEMSVKSLWFDASNTAGVAQNFTLRIRKDAAGVPGAAVRSETVSVPAGANLPSVDFNWGINSGTYWACIVLPANAHVHYYDGVAPGIGHTLYKWGTPPTIQDTDSLLFFDAEKDRREDIIFFEYRAQLYAVLNTGYDTKPELYENGLRGFSLDNPDERSELQQGSVPISSIDPTGCVIKLIVGKGSQEVQNWRKVTGKNGNNFVVDPPWQLAHDTTTEWVLLGFDDWTEIEKATTTLTKPVTSVLVIDDIVYFAQGDSTNIQRARLNAGTWTWQAEGTNKATFLIMIPDTTGKRKVWKALATTAKVAKSDVKAWGANLGFGADIVCGSPQYRITNILPYGTPQIPWVLKEDCIGSISSDFFAPVPLTEMAAVRDERNGRAATQFGVYLFFSLLDGVERFYDNRLDDLGPNRDTGFPTQRQGWISSILPYPGGLICALDAGASGYSSILYYNQIGWHEIYRAPFGTPGQRIRHLFLQVIPGESKDKLWFALDTRFVYVDMAINPQHQPDYKYQEMGTWESSWVQTNFGEINKFWQALTLHTEHLEAGVCWIKAYYQVDTDPLLYELPELFTQSPVQEVLFTTNYQATGKRLKIWLELHTADTSQSPVVHAITVLTTIRVPPARSWNVTVLTAAYQADMQGGWAEMNETGLRALLSRWANSDEYAKPLLMHAQDPGVDDCYVFIEPGSVTPIEITTEVGGRTRTRKAITFAIFRAGD